MASQQEAVVLESQETLDAKSVQVEQLENQLRQSALAHETRKRELIHNATLKSRTLQDMLRQLESELKTVRESAPLELKAKEDELLQLNQQLATEQARHQKIVARYDRALQTLARRGHQKEELLRTQLETVKEE